MAGPSTSQIPIADPTPSMSPFTGAQEFDTTVNSQPASTLDLPAVDTIARLPYFSIRNGLPQQATSMLVKATIPSAYYWRPIQNLPAPRAKEYIGAFIKTAYLGIWHNKPSGMDTNKVLKAAVLLGTARALVTSLYEINESDLIPGETAVPILSATHVGNGKYVFTTLSNLGKNIEDHMADSIALDEAMNNALPSIHMSSIGLPALQGWSLMMTGHHYLSDATSQSRKAYMVVEKQFWRANNVSSWWNDDSDLCTDTLWHKVCHPISLSLKYQWATSEQVRGMIVAAGAGSAAARLPAKETELRAANSYMVLLQTVRSMYEAYGGTLDYSVLDYAVALAGSYPSNPTLPPLEFAREPGTPTWVVDRPSALRFVAEVCKSNADIVAHAYGFYNALTEQSALMGTSAANDTLKTSFSLTKLRSQSTASYIAGYQAFSDYSAYKTKQRQAGEYAAIRMEMRYLELGPAPQQP